MSSDEKQQISGYLFFYLHLLGLVVLAAIMIMWLISQFGPDGTRTKLAAEKSYESDFYALLQGRTTESHDKNNQDLDIFISSLLGFRKEPKRDAFLDIVFGFSLAYEHALKKGGYGWEDNTSNGARRRLLFAGFNEIMLEKFSSMASDLQDPRFSKLVRKDNDRERIKSIIAGKNIPIVEVDMTLPSLWPKPAITVLFGQLLVGLCYFLMFWVHTYNSDLAGIMRWYHIPWSRIWPFLALPFWIPGALPVVAIACFVSGIKYMNVRRVSIAARQAERLSSERTNIYPEFDDEKLLSHLEERLKKTSQ